MIRQRHWPVMLLLALLAALSGWVYRQATQPVSPETAPTVRHPDAYATRARLSGYTPDGRLEYRLWAERMEHFPGDDSTELQRPYAELYRIDAPPWRISAHHGWVASQGDEIRLRGEVEIQRDGSPANRPVTAWSDSLDLWPGRDYAATDDKITYISDDLRVEAVGMRARLDTGELELLSGVRGVHTPARTTR
ncbi:lipopolysaccharide export system protein LptC [Thiohalobacter sp. COW1]|uniref:LPS export ABC transporter periplasmic protein LptC n=1 Tax=Thiohalobacter sp. COW1 TaxID=2795687 RepID=UPI001916B687|nr:LPS export ABC transporter periplasmic protein LptC [Thiohalobacter sp. COW1]BCO31532.1 lipopolysaccharide export system protein LptC [Thiohalobacter sp. COW1]